MRVYFPLFFSVLLLGSIVLPGLGLAGASLAELTYMSPRGKNAKWAKLPVKICASAEVPAAIREQLKEAARIWNQSFGKEIFSADCLLENPAYKDSDLASHGLYWIKADFEKLTDKTSLAKTVAAFADSGETKDADILLNGQYYDWSTLPIDARTVLVHELGHVLGLKHFFPGLDSAMNYFPYVSGYQHLTLGEYERKVISALYFEGKEVLPLYVRLFFQGKPKEAIRVLERSKKKRTEGEYFALGVFYRDEKNFKKSAKNFAKALEARPKADFVRLQLGDALWSQGDEAGAEKEFLRAVEENSNNYEALANLGSISLSKGDGKRGKEFLLKSLAIQPAHWAACMLLFRETKEEKYADCVKKYGPDL